MIQDREIAEGTREDHQRFALEDPSPILSGGAVGSMLLDVQRPSEAMDLDDVYGDPTTDTGFKMLLNKDRDIN